MDGGNDGGGGDTISVSAAPNPGERLTGRVAQGLAVQLVLAWTTAGAAPSVGSATGLAGATATASRFSVVAAGEAPVNGSWVTLSGVFAFDADPAPQAGAAQPSSSAASSATVDSSSTGLALAAASPPPAPDAVMYAEVSSAGVGVEMETVAVHPPWALPLSETAVCACRRVAASPPPQRRFNATTFYHPPTLVCFSSHTARALRHILDVPCQIDPATSPDMVLRIPPFQTDTVLDISLCSTGYDQTVTLYDDTGAAVVSSDGGVRALARLRGPFAHERVH